jgi:glycosyltransferase involved in cell wall biosynthesis
MSSTLPIGTPISILCVGMEWFPDLPSGLNRYAHELVYELAEQSDRVEFCGIDLPDQSHQTNLTLTNLASATQKTPQRLWQIRQMFKSKFRSHFSYDVVNLHFALYSLPFLSLIPKNVPIIFNFQGPWALESQWEGESQRSVGLKRWLEKRVYQRCDRFIVLTKAFGTILHESYNVPWEKIHIIPGGVNVHKFQPTLSLQQARSQLNFPQDRKILITPRRLVNRMGLDRLIEAMVQVKEVVPDVWLAIAGRGPLREKLELQVKDLGLQDHVKFLGFVPDEDLPVAYQASDLTVMPSQGLEGFGLTLAESLSCGTPAICTPIGGMPEVLSGLNPNLVMKSADTDAIAEKIIEMLTISEVMPSRQICRQYAVESFNWYSVAQRVRQVMLM